MNLEMIKNQIFGQIEKELKPLIGDLWYEFRDEALEWAKLVAQLEIDIATGNHQLANQITYDHVVGFGIPCFTQRLQSRVESVIANFLKSLLQYLLDAAVLAAVRYLKGQ